MSVRPGFNVDFQQAPLLVIWEITRACALACRHCRASAMDFRHPDELTLPEGEKLLDEVRKMGTPIVVFTGGDPLQRKDLEDLIRYGKSIGLRVGTIPAGTPRLTRERMQSLKESGIDQVAFSIDAPNPEDHDRFRQVPGSYELTLQGARWAQELEIPLQINTVFHQGNQHQIDELCERVASLGIVFWEVFFLVPTGRGSELKGCTAGEMEVIFSKLYALQKKVSFVIKVTEAQQYKRFVLQQSRPGKSADAADRELLRSRVRPSVSAHGGADTPAPMGMPKEIRAESGHPHAIGRSSKTVNAGNGFLFVDHTGNICPSGFMPVVRGNVRTHSLIEVYREDEFFLKLRNPELLKGKCGRCEFKLACGGSRSRAWAVHGDAWAEEPFCVLER